MKIPEVKKSVATQDVPSDVVRLLTDTILNMSEEVKSIRQDVTSLAAKLETIQTEQAAKLEAIRIEQAAIASKFKSSRALDAVTPDAAEDSGKKRQRREGPDSQNSTSKVSNKTKIKDRKDKKKKDKKEKDVQKSRNGCTLNGSHKKQSTKPVSKINSRYEREVMIAFGGRGLKNKMYDSCILFDPTRNRWVEHCKLPRPFYDAGVVLFNRTIYLFGGHDGQHARSEIFYFAKVKTDTGDGSGTSTKIWTWLKIGHLPQPISGHSCAVMDGKIYLTGGTADGKKCFVFAPNTLEVKTLAYLTASKSCAGLVSHPPSSSLYAVRLNEIPQAERYNAATDSWHPVRLTGDKVVRSRPVSSGHRLIASDTRPDLFYLLGADHGGRTLDLLQIDPSNKDTLICKRSSKFMCKSHSLSGAAICGGMLYVAGGEFQDEMEKCDLNESNPKWSQSVNMPGGVRKSFNLLTVTLTTHRLDKLFDS